MASVFRGVVLLLVVFLGLFSCARHGNAHYMKVCKFDRIYQMGDSISNTWNLIAQFPTMTGPAYGETFFNDAPGGSGSNGLSIIDYVAMAAGLPLLAPYTKYMDSEFGHGVSFAVAGSTALPPELLERNHIFSPTSNSLNVQLDWMTNHFNSICLDRRDCVEKLHHALFMVGEIGGNDYHYAILQGKTMDELKNMVPDVVQSIVNAARSVINMGGSKLVIPGIFPLGCLPMYQTAFQSNMSTAYDDNQCLRKFNEFAIHHNVQLQQAIYKLQQEEPNAVIVYGDYFNTYQFLLKFGRHTGMETEKACCGIGGKYNFNLARMCGRAGVPACPDPDRYISWDGVHLTQEGYKFVAEWLSRDIFVKFHCHY